MASKRALLSLLPRSSGPQTFPLTSRALTARTRTLLAQAQSPSPARRCSTTARPSIASARTTTQQMPTRTRLPKRHFTTTLVARKDDGKGTQQQQQQQQQATTQAPSKLYTFAEMQDLSASPAPHRIVIDVREPGELAATGRIPGARNLPVSSAADGFFLPADEFEERFGFARPGPGDEVIFYCKAGVRSRAAAALAQQAGFGGSVAEFPGSWIEWAEKGGEVER